MQLSIHTAITGMRALILSNILDRLMLLAAFEKSSCNTNRSSGGMVNSAVNITDNGLAPLLDPHCKPVRPERHNLVKAFHSIF